MNSQALAPLYHYKYRGGGVTSVYVHLCPVLFGFYETTDVFFGTLADIDGLGRTLADSDGHLRTRTDICGLRRTLADSDGLVLQRGGMPYPRSHNKGDREPLSPKSCAKKFHNVCPPRSAYVLSFFGFYETTDVFFGSLADIDGHYRGTLESGL